jgi:type II secretory pathway pseudopilin PulG
MFCPKCGVENNDIAKFCKECGGALKIDNDKPAVEVNTSSKIATTQPPKSVLFYALMPVGFFIGLIVLWGIVNVFADVENPSAFYAFFNSVLVPLLFALTFLAIPVGIIYAVYTNSKNYDGTIKCGNCEYVGEGKKGRSVWAQVVVWILFFFFWPITLVYYLVTHSYLCPKCKSTFVGLRSKNGDYSASRSGIGPLGIALLVFLFIAIIGILASVVLASLNSARDKGQDAATKSALNNARAQAELYYDDNSNSYLDVCDNQSIKKLFSPVESNNETYYTCNDSTRSWAASSALNEDGYYCVDSEGSAGEVSSPLISQTHCSGVKVSDSKDYTKWETYFPVYDDFSILFPTYPNVDSDLNISTDDPTLTFDIRTYESSEGTGSFWVYTYTYSEPIDLSDPDSLLEIYLSQIADTEEGYKLLSSNYTYKLGNRALEFKVSIDNEEVKGFLMLTDESVVYLIMNNYYAGSYKASSYEKFVNSFKVN